MYPPYMKYIMFHRHKNTVKEFVHKCCQVNCMKWSAVHKLPCLRLQLGLVGRF